jgi:tetratricopeptide (TPR) repeat protein
MTIDDHRAIVLPGLCNCMIWVAIFYFGMTAYAVGQTGNRDYYSSDPEDRALLKTVHLNHLQPGISKMQKGEGGGAKNITGALADFEFILRYFPNDPEALNLASELCTRYKAQKCPTDLWFQNAIARNPDAAMTYVVFGIHLQRVGRPDLAVASLRKAISLQPDSVNAHYNLGLAYFELKDYDQANREAQQSYALGAQLPGLKDKLVKVGKWKPLPPEPGVASAPDQAPVPGTAK